MVGRAAAGHSQTLGPMRRFASAALLASALVTTAGAAAPATHPQPAPPPAPAVVARDTAVFAGGCFWGVEGVFEHVRGVVDATSGYAAAGQAPSVGYEDVSTGRTPYAESVRVIYDPRQVSYAQLLEVFFTVAHDPTTKDRQGPDVGPQYRSAVFYRDDAQRRAAAAYIAALGSAHAFPRPVVTEVSPLGTFRVAEAYHQGYMARHPESPYITANDAPKLVALQRKFPARYRG